MKNLFIVLLFLIIVTSLSSCGSSVQAINGRIEKQIKPSASAPAYTSDASLVTLPNGDLLYLNERRNENELIISLYNNQLSLKWEDTVEMVDDDDERIDWNALRIDPDSVCIFSTYTYESREGGDSAQYFARMISLGDGSMKKPVHLCSFPVGDEHQRVVKVDLANMIYDRLGGKKMINAYHSPDQKTFLVTTYKYVVDAKDIELTFNLFAKDLRPLKNAKLKLLLGKRGEESLASGKASEDILAALPTNSGDILIATYNPDFRILRFIRYALSGDGSTSELTHTFEALDGYDAYSFKFAPLSGNGNKLYVGVCVFDPPSQFFSTGNSDHGSFYIGSVNFDEHKLRFSSYVPSKERLEAMFGDDQMQSLGLKYFYVDESQDRILVVLEESLSNTSERTYSRIAPGPPRSASESTGAFARGQYEPIHRETVSRGSVTKYQSNDILLAAFDTQHNPIWERGISNTSWDYDDMYLGCTTSLKNNKLSLWYPSPAILHYYEIDFITGKRLSSDDKELVMKFSGMYLLSPFSLLDAQGNMFFLVHDGKLSSDSFLFKIQPN